MLMLAISLFFLIIIIMIGVYLNILFSHKQLSQFTFTACIDDDPANPKIHLTNLITGNYVEPPTGNECDVNNQIQTGITNIDLLNKIVGNKDVSTLTALLCSPLVLLLLYSLISSNSELISDFLSESDSIIPDLLPEEENQKWGNFIFLAIVFLLIGFSFYQSTNVDKKIVKNIPQFTGDALIAVQNLQAKILRIGHSISALLVVLLLLITVQIMKEDE
jgi:hypothetical protein